MSRAASLPGANFFSQIDFFFEETTCPGQLRYLGQNFCQKIEFLKKPLVPGSFAAWGSFFPENLLCFKKKPLVPGSFAAWGRIFLKSRFFFEQTTCPGQLRCLGQMFSQQSDCFLNKPLIPGSFVAWGRFFSQNTTFFGRSNLSRLFNALLLPSGSQASKTYRCISWNATG